MWFVCGLYAVCFVLLLRTKSALLLWENFIIVEISPCILLKIHRFNLKFIAPNCFWGFVTLPVVSLHVCHLVLVASHALFTFSPGNLPFC